MVISIASSVLRLLNVQSMLLIYISTFMGGIAGGAVVPLTSSMQADNTSYVQMKTGARAEAAIASLASFITKVAQGIGGAIPGYVLAMCGFVEGQAAQPDSVKTGIILCVLVIPVVITSIGAVLFATQYKLEE